MNRGSRVRKSKGTVSCVAILAAASNSRETKKKSLDNPDNYPNRLDVYREL